MVRMMRLGIVSDTHGHVANALQAVRLLEGEQVDAVLHCGDIGSHRIVPLFAGWPTHFVFGNCDDDLPLLRASIRDAGLTCHDWFGELELAGRRIALLHGHERRRLSGTIESGAYDLVCHGHTHVAEVRQAGSTLVLNPGALYRADPHTIALVELPALTVRHLEVRDEGGGESGEVRRRKSPYGREAGGR